MTTMRNFNFSQASNAPGPLSGLKSLLGMSSLGSAEECQYSIFQLQRAELAQEFDIEAIRFEPTEFGVIEIGRASQKWDGVLRSKFDEVLEEGFEPAYAMFWELRGDTFEIVADYVTDER